MQLAVDALYEVTKLEDGIRSGKIVVSTNDIGEYLSKLVNNLDDSDNAPFSFEGEPVGVMAVFDQITLMQVLEHLINNAARYRIPQSPIQFKLQQLKSEVAVEVFNFGPSIPKEDLVRIFGFGVTDRKQTENRGLGLFMSSQYMLAMRGSLHAEYRPDGAAFIIKLPVP